MPLAIDAVLVQGRHDAAKPSSAGKEHQSWRRPDLMLDSILASRGGPTPTPTCLPWQGGSRKRMWLPGWSNQAGEASALL